MTGQDGAGNRPKPETSNPGTAARVDVSVLVFFSY